MSPAPVDITGERSGKLVAREPTDERRGHSVVWIFDCDCGGTIKLPATYVRQQAYTHCGCVPKPWTRGRRKTTPSEARARWGSDES